MKPNATTFREARVGIVGPFLPRSGGVSVQTEMLCRFLEREGVRVHRINTDVPSIRALPVVGRWLLPFAQVIKVAIGLLLAAPRSDILHAQAASGWGFTLPVGLSLLFGRLFRRRVVASYFGGNAAKFLERRHRWVLPVLHRLDGLAVSSRFLKEVFERYGLAPALVPSVIEIERFPFCPRQEWPPLILWVRSLHAHANPTMALRAFALVRETLPEARLMMIGHGPLAHEVAAVAKELNLAEAVAYRPWLPFHRLREVLQSASVRWNTNTIDNFPLGLLEAAASGTVIVSTDVGGIGEMLHDGVDALLVAPDDHAAMAAATVQVLRRPVLANGLARNARLAVERYTWVAIRSDVAKLYGLTAQSRGEAEEALEPPPPGVGSIELEVMGLRGRAEFLKSDPLPADSGPSPWSPPVVRSARRRPGSGGSD